jgi:hypothetical protein
VFSTAHSLGAQPIPQFKLPQWFLQPGGVIEIYGTNLAPQQGCGVQFPPVGPFPTEACGVQVTAGGIPAGLRYVGPKQINVDLPMELPEGPAAVRVCVLGLCSDPVVKEFSAHRAFLRATEPLYAGMPLWIDVGIPVPYLFAYPCRTDPWDFHGRRMDTPTGVDQYKMEVRRDGTLLAEAAPPRIGLEAWELKRCCMSGIGGGVARFPLHLAYRLEGPGLYSIRITGTRDSNTVVQSAWTDIEVRPFSPEAKEAWLSRMQERIKSARAAELMGDIVPSLLASPDERALRMLLPVYSAWLGPRMVVGMDIFLVGYLRNSLAAFDADLLRRVVPPTILCPPAGRCY